MQNLLYIYFFLFSSIAQTNQVEPLVSVLESLSKQITEVTTEKYSYQQSLDYNHDDPYQLIISIVATSDKGKSTTMHYLFNLAHINAKSLAWESGKDKKVSLKANKSQKVIKIFKDDEQQNFDDELFIFCNDVDKAREIIALLEDAIPLATEAWKANMALPDDIDGLATYLQNHITRVNQDDKTIDQQLKAELHWTGEFY